MKNQTITSREYKLILNSDRFQDLETGLEAFWHIVGFTVDKSGGQVVERQDDVWHRTTWYLDVPNHVLHKNGWIVRVRKQEQEYKLTLKVRSSDRYLASSSNVGPGKAVKKSKRKFEEDVLPPFVSKFSHSTSVKFIERPKLSKVKDLAEYFPGIKTLGMRGSEKLGIVNQFKAHETCRWMGKAKIDNGHEIKACLNFWYPTKKRKGIPLIAEFSFDYDLDVKKGKKDKEALEQFDAPTAQLAATVFASLQKQNGWVQFHATTKTQYAYNAF